MKRYPLDPLLALHGGSIKSLARAVVKSGGRAPLYRAKERGLHWISADRYAIAHGLHPAELWPDWLADVTAGDGT